MMKVKLDEGAYMPERAHKADAGLDLRTPEDCTVPGSAPAWLGKGVDVGTVTINTGVHIAIPEGFVGMIKSKSGLNVKCGLTAEGVIDSGYTGPIKVKLYNHKATSYSFFRGDKVAQLVILPCSLDGVEKVDDLEATERGNGGFGSTGR